MSFLLRDESFDCRFINMGIVLVNCVPGFFQSSSGLQQGGSVFSLFICNSNEGSLLSLEEG